MTHRWSPIVTVILGVVLWIVATGIVDAIVLRIYPLPPGLIMGETSIREIIASRPDAAIALNLICGIILLGLAAFAATRLARGQSRLPGLIVTGLIVTLALVNSVITANFRWLVAVAFPLLLLFGYLGARTGAGRSPMNP